MEYNHRIPYTNKPDVVCSIETIKLGSYTAYDIKFQESQEICQIASKHIIVVYFYNKLDKYFLYTLNGNRFETNKFSAMIAQFDKHKNTILNFNKTLTKL